jgi:hypothetical protein
MKNILVFLMIALSLAPLHGAETSKIERIAGDFIVQKISKLSSGAFVVEFKATEGEPKFTRLRLESNNINAAIVEGASLRLSADVTRVSGRLAEVAQVVVYLPGLTGPTPVWMLSRKAPRLDPPAKLLELHAPSTDFAVF